MGNVPLTAEDDLPKGMEPQTVSISLSAFRHLNPEAKHLANLKLDQIREVIERFKQLAGGKNYKNISVRTFQELGLMNLNISKAFFNFFDVRFTRKLDFYMLMVGLIWMAFAKINQKLLCKGL